MKTPPLAYHRPDSLDEALDLLAEHGGDAKVLAGGQSMMPLLAMRLARPEHLVDVNNVAGMSGISDRGDQLAFGATTREREAERSPIVARRLPLLAEALPLIGHVSIRNRGTIGGSIAHADASAELPLVSVMVDAELVVRSATAERVLAAADFFVGHFTTAMADDECLVEVRMPVGAPGAGWAMQEVARRHGDFALVGAAAMLVLTDDGRIAEARVGLIGVADRAIRATKAEVELSGASVSPDTFASVAADAVRDLRPASDVHGSSAYRRHLAEVVVRRALTIAAERAGGLEQ